MKTEKDSRKTISIAKVIMDWAEEMMLAQGFNKNFSAYVAHLIREDKKAQEERQIALFKLTEQRDATIAPRRQKKTGT